MASDETEAARTRRRWITLAEVLGVAAVLISALTFWNSYKERTSREAESEVARADAAAARRAEARAAESLLLRGTPDREGSRLSLAPANGGQTIQSQTIRFPAALGVSAAETIIEPRIEAEWFARPLLRARQAAGTTEAPGDQRVPVAIITRFYADNTLHTDAALYDVGYRTEGGGLFEGRQVRLRGLSRLATVPADQAQARLDALWQRRTPAAPSPR